VEYASKETFSGTDRDLDSDTFSLGCVFLEMVTVILGESFINLYAHFSGKKPDNIQTPDNIRVVYCKQSAEVNSWVEKLRVIVKKGTKGAVAPGSQCKALDEKSLDMILKMMSEHPAERPGLRQVIKEFEQLREKCANCHPVVRIITTLSFFRGLLSSVSSNQPQDRDSVPHWSKQRSRFKTHG
jgi:hypothetical protein